MEWHRGTAASDRGAQPAADPRAGLGPGDVRGRDRGAVRRVLVGGQPAPEGAAGGRVRGRAQGGNQPHLSHRQGRPRVAALDRRRSLAARPGPGQGAGGSRAAGEGRFMTDDGVLEVSIHIAAPPETVFRYFTDPGRYVQWMGSGATLEPVPGGTYRILMRGGVAAAGGVVGTSPPPRLGGTPGRPNDPA